MATMNRGVIAAGLEEVLSGTGPFTVFAPSDLAFAKLETGAFYALFKPENRAMLADLLNYHIVRGKFEFKDLTADTKLNALDGKELSVDVQGSFVRIIGATIQNRDVQTSNGVIHSLDRILKS